MYCFGLSSLVEGLFSQGGFLVIIFCLKKMKYAKEAKISGWQHRDIISAKLIWG